MRIIVSIKVVPGVVTKLQVAKAQDRVDYESGAISINEADDYALEEALALKKELGGEVTLVSVGALSAQQALYAGLAKGADRAIRVGSDLTDPESISRVLAEAIKTVDYDLVLTGTESSDNMAARVGGSVAEMLGLPFAYGVVEVKGGERPGIIQITKELGGGVKQMVEICLPAVLSIQSGILPVSFVALGKLMEARKKPVETLTLSALGIKEGDLKAARKFRIVDVFPPPRPRGAEIIEGEPSDTARVLSEKIKEVLR